MKVLAIQHDAADPPAGAGEVVLGLGHELEVIRLDKGNAIPQVADADLLMTFGGGISFARVADADELPPWVAEEQSLVRQYAQTGRRVLGICLGSQMIASALGAKVRRNPEPEVGWHTVQPTEVAGNAGEIAKHVISEPLTVFHWHQDTFDIPDGATHWLRSEGCDHQGYVIDNRIFGLQFHLEATEKTVNTFMAVSRLWRQDARFVQTEQEIIAGASKYLSGQRAVLEKLLGGLLS